MAEDDKLLAKNTLEILHEILKWSRFENFPKLRKILLDSLKTDQEKLVYELTDGEKSRYDIAKEIGISDSTVRSWWERWYNLGILEPSGKRKGRPQKIVALEDMGIEVPRVATVARQKQNRTQEPSDQIPSEQNQPSDIVETK